MTRVFHTFQEYLEYYRAKPPGTLKGKSRAYRIGAQVAKDAIAKADKEQAK